MEVEPHPPTRLVTAYNDAADSGNPMHNDAAARAMNFRGALVPGVTVFGFVTHPFVSHFGDSWLAQGSIQVQFRKPVYVGEVLSVESTSKEDLGEVNLYVKVYNPDGEVCVVACGSMAQDSSILSSITHHPLPPHRAVPDPKWPAVRERFASERVFGSISQTFTSGEADKFLDLLQDDNEIYRRGITHPAWLLRQANIIVDQNFAVGPWIHVASEIRNYGMAQNDERIEIRAQVIDLFEKKGKEYFDIDVALLANGDPENLIMRVSHRAIYDMGSAP
tara:strand:+ start:1756 stop:2586 length:831 start_codon:yes stop_codon:yes gene_type:complete